MGFNLWHGYIFVFWLNNTCNWIAALMIKNVDYITAYPANLFSFLLTTVGLLAVAMFAAYFSIKTIRAQDFNKLNLKRIGVIIVAFGLYFDIIFVMYLFLGAVGGWGEWYAWFFGHNMDLWLMALPMVGVPFSLSKQSSKFACRAMTIKIRGTPLFRCLEYRCSSPISLPDNDNF